MKTRKPLTDLAMFAAAERALAAHLATRPLTAEEAGTKAAELRAEEAAHRKPIASPPLCDATGLPALGAGTLAHDATQANLQAVATADRIALQADALERVAAEPPGSAWAATLVELQQRVAHYGKLVAVTRQIAKTPGAAHLVAMPSEYDPELVDADDIEHDSMILGARGELRPIMAASMAQWDVAVDTADEPAAEAKASADRSAAMEAWEGALDACDDGDAPRALAFLQTARSLADAWGDDAEERRALALFGEEDAS